MGKNTLHIIPIVYDSLPEPDIFLNYCEQVANKLKVNELFKYYKLQVLYQGSFSKYSEFIIKGIIPPSNLRYNDMDGWLTVSNKIRWRLGQLKTQNPVCDGSDFNYPNINEEDMVLAIIPLSIETSTEIWDQEKHFGPSGEYHGSSLKVFKFPYHVSLTNDKNEISEQFFKELNIDEIAYTIVENIADSHMGISDVQMQTIKIKFGYETEKKGKENELFDRLRVFFYGSDICSYNLLKQSILLFDDIHFHDRPSFKIGALGSIGSYSRIRPYLYSFAEKEIPIIVHKGFKSMPNNIFDDSVANEIEDPRFSKIFMDGFRTDENFRNLFIQPNANYGKGVGQEIINSMIKLNLENKPYDLNKYKKLTEAPYNPNSNKSLEETFANFLIDASMKLNLCCVTSHENDLIPFTEYPTLEKMLALRHKRIVEKGELPDQQPNAKLLYLSRKVFEQVIPPELIEQASVEQIINFRKENHNNYLGFRKYLMSLNMTIESETWDDRFEKEVNEVLIKKIIPAIDDFQNECKRIWEKMFGNIAKKLIAASSISGISSFYISCYTGFSWLDLFVKGCGLAAPVVLPNVIDFALEKRNLNRKNTLSYLVDLNMKIKS